MQRWWLRLLALGLGGAAGLVVVRQRRRRLALVAPRPLPPDPPASYLAEENMQILASGEGMPEPGV